MKKLFTNLRNWCLDLLALMFNEKRHRVISVTIILGIAGMILSQTFVPWANPSSYFSNQNQLFQSTVRVSDILAALEAGNQMIYKNKVSEGLIFMWLTFIGTFFAKILAAKIARKYTQSLLSALIVEEMAQSSLFYIFSLISFLFLPAIINAFTSQSWFNEAAAIVIVILLIASSAIAIPAALYLGVMSISLFLTYQLLSYIENDIGLIVTMMVALAANLILDYLCTPIMLKPVRAALDRFNIHIDL